MVDGLSTAGDPDAARKLAQLVKRLKHRNFLVRNVHTGELTLMQARCAMTTLRGPMTRSELMAALKARGAKTESNV